MRSSAVLGAALALGAPWANANLLRNGSFQDDWITRLPENKNHHWCYPSEYQNRRDYNPDGWFLSGSWAWENADAPAGERRLVLRGPKAAAAQRLNWVLVHDDRNISGFPDAGGFPAPAPQRSTRPLSLVRDLKLRARVRGEAVPENAGSLELSFEPPAPLSPADPIGGKSQPTVGARAALPSGTYAARWVELTLAGSAWLEAARAAEPAATRGELERAGPVLPGAVRVALRYEGRAGSVSVERVELVETGAPPASLLPNGSFESLGPGGYPAGWSQPQKYGYFPPRHYYIFNTWHNGSADNRGLVSSDALLASSGERSLKMLVPAGDETFVESGEVALNQREPRLLEVSAWVKTDRLNMLQVDLVDEAGQRLDAFNFIHKAQVSIGSDDWRRIRQVARPRRPLRGVRVRLAARGVNGYTLDDTGTQPQNNSVGTVFWDDVRLSEPESAPDELRARGVAIAAPTNPQPTRPRLAELDLGERLLGDNVLAASVFNPGPAAAVALHWELRAPGGRPAPATAGPVEVPSGGTRQLTLSYPIGAAPLAAYSEYRGSLALVDAAGSVIARSELWLSPWAAPIDLELGALYLEPEQSQLVRINLGFTAAAMAALKTVRLELLRRGSGELLKAVDLAADPSAIRSQRARIPADLREDFTNLLLADLDVSGLPVQPFAAPERNWQLRARAFDAAGVERARATSAPFCRQARAGAQPAIESVRIDGPLRLLVNGKPFMPWGAVYGYVPVYSGPADPGQGKYRDLLNLPDWSLYDRFDSSPRDRARSDFNAARYVSGKVTPLAEMEKRWTQDNLLASSAFALPKPAFSLDEAFRGAGGRDALDAYLEACRRSPMVVSIAAGIEEAFGLFQGKKAAELDGLRAVAERLRQASGRPVMVGHGGYWTRLELEKVPFFDIFDPETEPLFPANLHTDLMPLIAGQPKTAWLRPQMYEDVPFERWRFHALVELMRGARGWQVAHGPGDASLLRGLHGELEQVRDAAFSREPAPAVRATPWLETWARRANGRVYVIAATTHGVPFGRYASLDEAGPGGRARATDARRGPRDATDPVMPGAAPGLALHGIEYLPDARAWPAGSRLTQWVRLDAADAPRGLLVLVKTASRFTHAATWGAFEVSPFRGPRLAWFLRSLYRNAAGFLGWDDALVPSAAEYAPASAARQGALPAAGRWVRLELALDDVGATDALLDGVAFLHEGGRVDWGRTALAAGDGRETIVWGDRIGHDEAQLARARIDVPGLAAGTRVRVLSEDRELVSGDGHLVDDFRGQDLYQRYGGVGAGYGAAPVAVHVYEIPDRVSH